MPTIKRLAVNDVVLESTRTTEVLAVRLSENMTLYSVRSVKSRVTGLDIYVKQCQSHLTRLGYGKCKYYYTRRLDAHYVNMSKDGRGVVAQASGPTVSSAVRKLVQVCAELPSVKPQDTVTLGKSTVKVPTYPTDRVLIPGSSIPARKAPVTPTYGTPTPLPYVKCNDDKLARGAYLRPDLRK